jgi:acetyltransferase-like isoleucine patch superfamily enzyme
MIIGERSIMELAPIVLFVYNRSYHAQQTLEALSANDLADQSTLYIYSDGPKSLASPEDIKKIEGVREFIKSKKWCKTVNVIEAPYNIGLANSFVKGVSEVVNKHGKVIVLEDDQITSRGFLRYMNEALELYADDPQVMHISAYMYPAKFESKTTTFFLSIQSCPGWGTWKRAWDHYNPDAGDHLQYFSRDKNLIKEFDIDGHAYFFYQLKKNVEIPNYSFAVKWYASCIRAGGLSLFPARSLVRNNGMDGTGEHCQPTNMYDVEPVEYLEIEKIPIIENKEVRKSVDLYYKQHLKKKFSFSPKVFLKSSLRKMGTGKVKNMLRWGLKKIYPELGLFTSNKVGWSTIDSYLEKSMISEKVKLNPPYHTLEVKIEEYTYISRNSWICNTSIGKFCSIGPNFHCGWGMHPVDGISTSPMFYSTSKQNGTTLCTYDKFLERKPVKIGNDVFIGMNVSILDGVTIGNGAVIGAGTVVSKDVPPYAIVAGTPMRIIRYRFSEETIQKLQELAWWDWPLEKLKLIEENFFDVDTFVLNYARGSGNADGN